MRVTRTLGLLLAAVMVSLTLAGCTPGNGTEARGASIAKELKALPRVAEVNNSFTESGLGVAPYSSLFVTLYENVTEPEVLDILTTFDAANRAAGVETVSTTLTMWTYASDWEGSAKLELDVAKPDSKLLSSVTRAWFELRERYSAAEIIIRKPYFGSNPVGYELTITMPEGSTAASELEAIRDVSAVFADVGEVTSLFIVGGLFRVDKGMPSEDAIALVEAMERTEGILDMSGDFFGQEIMLLNVKVADPRGPVDPTVGVPSAIVQLVDLIRADAPALSIEFARDDDPLRGWFFDNDECARYLGLSESDSNRALLLYWASDGRTLLDGSTAESCFS